MFLIAIVISVLVFLALRQLFLWYWKVDVIVKKQDEQTQLLKNIYNALKENNKLAQEQIELVIGKEDDK